MQAGIIVRMQVGIIVVDGNVPAMANKGGGFPVNVYRGGWTISMYCT